MTCDVLPVAMFIVDTWWHLVALSNILKLEALVPLILSNCPPGSELSNSFKVIERVGLWPGWRSSNLEKTSFLYFFLSRKSLYFAGNVHLQTLSTFESGLCLNSSNVFLAWIDKTKVFKFSENLFCNKKWLKTWWQWHKQCGWIDSNIVIYPIQALDSKDTNTLMKKSKHCHWNTNTKQV